MPPSEATRGLDDLALSVYLDRLFRGRRVLWLGDAASGGPDRAARVAASILAADPHAIADRVERHNLRVVRLSQGAALPAGPYDVIVVADLAGIGLATPDRVRQLAAALAPGGVLVAASANPDAGVRLGRPSDATPPAYEALYDLLAQRFPAVRMLGQAPFVGYTVVDFSTSGEPSVVFDGALLGDASEAPERFVALCGETETVLDGYAVVQLPARAALGAVVVAPPTSPSEETAQRELGVARDEIRAARERGAHLSRELDDLRAQQRSTRAASAPRVGTLEAELRAAREQIDAANVHAEELETTLAQRTAALAELDGEVERSRMELGSVRDESETRVAALRIARDELEKLRATPVVPPGDHARLEELLRERGRELLARDAELARRATLFRDLVEELRALREGRLIDETSAAADVERRVGESMQRVTALEAQLLGVRAEREAAVQRALRAEAERTEAVFRADETLGRLAEATERSERVDEDRARREAELSGFVRGLRARAAELEELRGQAEARFAMQRLDLDESARRLLDVERAREELRDQLELQIVRASGVGQASPMDAGPEALDLLRAERDGLRARLDDREAALASRIAAPEPGLAARLEEAGARAAVLVERLGAAEVAAEAERQRVVELSARVAQREAALRGLEADVEVRDVEFRAATSRVAALESEARRLGAALGEARASLSALGAGLEAGAGTGSRPSLAGGLDATGEPAEPSELPALRHQLDGLQHELRDRELLLRSLTAQLQERGERLRALEQRATAEPTAMASVPSEVRRLEEQLRAREAELALVQGRVRSTDRELVTARDTVAESRAGLEELLASATTRGDAAAADRISGLIRALSRV